MFLVVGDVASRTPSFGEQVVLLLTTRKSQKHCRKKVVEMSFVEGSMCKAGIVDAR